MISKNLVVLSVLLLILITVGYLYYVNHYICNSTERGQFGDMLNGLNVIITALAFIGLIVNIRMQQGEIESTSKAFQIQAFESKFFNLIGMHSQVLENLRITFEGMHHVQTGIDSITNYYARLEAQVFMPPKDDQIKDMPLPTRYQLFFKDKYSDGFYQYFNFIRNILDYVDSNKDLVDVEFYLRTISLKLSREEHLLLYYHVAMNETDKIFEEVYRKLRFHDYFKKSILYDEQIHSTFIDNPKTYLYRE